MNDSELFHTALVASGLVSNHPPNAGKPSVNAFATRVLNMNTSNARQIVLGTKFMSGAARVICMLIIMNPEIVETIELALAQVLSEITYDPVGKSG